MPAANAFDREYPELREKLRRYGRSRFPALGDGVDDLVSQTLLDLWEYLERGAARKGRPRAFKRDEIRRLAFTIFKRRAADAFRASAARWTEVPLESEELRAQDPAAEETDVARIDLLRRMLRVCVAELAGASRADRDLLAVAAGLGEDGPLGARERQRLHRLRKRLAAAVRRELGEEASALLNEAL